MSHDLVQFLLARIAEDEERGQSLVAQWFDVGNACQSCGTDGKRLLADCMARRQIIEYFLLGVAIEENGHARTVLHLLAQPYAEHSDYDEAWRL